MSRSTHDDDFLEFERYEFREPPRYRFDANRREFVQVLGSGLMIAAVAAHTSAQQRDRSRSGRGGRAAEKLSERFHIDLDGRVTVLTGKVEVGQGSRTQITQAVAEELRLKIDQIDVLMADTQLCPDDGGTAGSRTTPSTIPRVRASAAAARDILIELAARQWQIDRENVRYADGMFSDVSSQREMLLRELVRQERFAAVMDEPAGDQAVIAEVGQWKVLGTHVPKVNGAAIVTGAHKYPSDIARPDMLYGKVLRPPSYGATLQEIRLDAADSLPNVKVVRDGDFVGCIAENSWTAARAIGQLAAAAKWDAPAHPSSHELFDHLKRTAKSEANGWPNPRSETWGDPAEGMAAASQRLKLDYTIAYIQHAPMEPRAAVAEWSDGKLTVWTGSQQPMRVRGELMEAFHLPAERVRVIVPDTGGGFGGKHSGEAAVEAARLAQAAGQPVSLRWTRKEEFVWAYCRPAGVIEVEAGLNDAGRLSAWSFTNYNSGGSAIETPYRIPHGKTQFLAADSPLRQGSYRALASTANTFARESAMDELAAQAGTDPLQFRLSHLPEGRLRDVLQAAARQFNWMVRRQGVSQGHGVGMACGTEKGSYVAACAEVQVVGDAIKVLSVCEAYECGSIQNPGNLRAQVEGCIIMGLGGALTERMEFTDGQVTNASFSQYLVPRMDDVPDLDIVLLDRPDLPSVGAGETPIIAVAPAIANAIYHAVGKRLRSMPLIA